MWNQGLVHTRQILDHTKLHPQPLIFQVQAGLGLQILLPWLVSTRIRGMCYQSQLVFSVQSSFKICIHLYFLCFPACMYVYHVHEVRWRPEEGN